MNTVNLENISDATGNYLIYNAGNGGNFDRIAVKMSVSDFPPFLAPVRIVNKYGSFQAVYSIGSYKSIDAVKMRMTKAECCTLLNNMLTPMMNCGEWLLDYHSFLCRKEYILCDPGTFSVKYIYILDKGYGCSDGEIMDTLRSIFRSTDIIDDKDFRIELLQTLLDESFSISGLYEMVTGIMKKSAAKPAPVQPMIRKEPPAPASVPVQNTAASAAVSAMAKLSKAVKEPKEQKPAEPVVNFDNGEDDDFDMSNLFSGGKKEKKPSKEKKAPKEKKPDKLGGIFGKSKPSKEKSPAAAVMDERTVIEGIDNDETQIASAFLVLESGSLNGCPQRIDLTMGEGGSMTIGRKGSDPAVKNADVEFPADCKAISRTHCRIRLESGVYGVSDMNSGNGTFVNGNRVQPGTWAEVQSGGRITLGNGAAVYVLQIN